VAFGGAGALYGAVLVVLPDRVGAEVFGETWIEAAELVGIVALGEALRLTTFAAIDLVKVLGSPMALVRTRALAAIGVVVGLLAGATIAGPAGAATCLALGYAVASGLWWRQARDVAASAEP
jgi:O-antigen/teichoic acid export membrane protein